MTNEPKPSSAASAPVELSRRHRRVGLTAAAGALVMLLMAFAAVPLYRMFCQATGYSGTPQTASRPSEIILDRTIEVRFDASVSPELAWTVVPVETTKTVRLGETAVAYYRATNNSDRPLVGTSSFNVSPDQTGAFFNKLQCFCFTEQRLEPGQTLDMGVSFFVSPELASDKDTSHIGQITLSYTFYPVDKPKISAAGSSSAGPGKGS